MKKILPGFFFAALWASASVATKLGIQQVHPLLLANIRFLIAGSALLGYAYFLKPVKAPLPSGKMWQQLFIFSLLNTTIYLGAYVMALREVSAGIGSLSTATNPLFIILLSAIWLKRRLHLLEIIGIVLGMLGVALATYPLLHIGHTTIKGLMILLGGMLSVSAATVYYARISWQLPNIVINGWQILIGGFSLLPFTLFFADFRAAHWNMSFFLSVAWLIIPVSIIALQLWFYLVQQDAVRASLWLFLCPIFGFVYAAILVNEPITGYTYTGTLLVLTGLFLAQRERFRKG